MTGNERKGLRQTIQDIETQQAREKALADKTTKEQEALIQKRKQERRARFESIIKPALEKRIEELKKDPVFMEVEPLIREAIEIIQEKEGYRSENELSIVMSFYTKKLFVNNEGSPEFTFNATRNVWAFDANPEVSLNNLQIKVAFVYRHTREDGEDSLRVLYRHKQNVEVDPPNDRFSTDPYGITFFKTFFAEYIQTRKYHHPLPRHVEDAFGGGPNY